MSYTHGQPTPEPVSGPANTAPQPVNVPGDVSQLETEGSALPSTSQHIPVSHGNTGKSQDATAAPLMEERARM